MAKICYKLPMKHYLLAASLTLTAGLAANPAFAQTIIMGDGSAQACYQSAKMGDQGSNHAIRTCGDALRDSLTRRDEAATHVNRGVLLMRRGDTDQAIEDYTIAIKMRPELAEAYINQGVALFHQGRDEEALMAYDRAIALKTDQMAEVLYNRALAYERLGDAKAAYYDLKAALELQPEWKQAQETISRFTVTRRNS